MLFRSLRRYGCDVTVYEALHVVGGVLQYGIPSFRLPREIISREVDHLRALGVKFETNKVIGKTFSVQQQKDLGLVGNGPDGTLGNFDMARVQTFIDKMIATGSFPDIPAGFKAETMVTNEFIDPSIGL